MREWGGIRVKGSKLRRCGSTFWGGRGHMKIYDCVFAIRTLDLGLPFTPLSKAPLTALKQTPGMSPMAWPLQPNLATRTSSFSSIKFKQPSLGTKAVTVFLDILDQLDPGTLPDGRIWLFGFNPSFFSLHGKFLQKGWLSGLCPNGLFFCTVYYATSVYCQWLWSFLAVQRHHRPDWAKEHLHPTPKEMRIY